MYVPFVGAADEEPGGGAVRYIWSCSPSSDCEWADIEYKDEDPTDTGRRRGVVRPPSIATRRSELRDTEGAREPYRLCELCELEDSVSTD